jgi:cytochrome bd-type quinol oxidase subunit 2
MKRFNKTIVLFLSLLFLLSFVSSSLAQDSGAEQKKGLKNAFGSDSFLSNVAQKAGFIVEENDDDRIFTIIGQVINIFLSLLGVIFMILVIIAGYKWMTAAGNEEQVTQAKSYLKYAIIGLFVITLTWGVWALMKPILEAF